MPTESSENAILRKFAFTAILVFSLTLPALSADGDFYSSSPAEGEFSDDGEVISDNSFEAGSITVETEGVLPPTEEKVKIYSGGTQGNTYGLGGCRFDVDDKDEIAGDAYCEFNRGPSGSYIFDVNYSLTAQAETVNTLYQCGKGSTSISAEPYVDDGPPGNSADNDQSPYESDEKWFDNYYDIDKGGDTNERAVGSSNSVSGNRSKVEDTYYEVINVHGDTTCTTEDTGKTTYHETTEEFRSQGSVVLGYQEQNPDSLPNGASYYGGASGNEKFYMYFNVNDYSGEVTHIVPDYSIRNGLLTYITPAGNSYLDIDGKFFSGDSYSNDDEYTTKLSEVSDHWQNTSKTIDLEFPEMAGRPAGGTGQVVVEGEYYAGSTSGVNPESYRWVLDSNTSKVLTSHSNIGSDSTYGYRSYRKRFDFRDTDLKSGTYKLQIKSNANYEVEFKQRDFQVKRDSYIDYQDSRTFNPEFKIGSNDLTLFTRASNEARYDINWDECYESELASDFTPANNSYIPTRNPTLGLTTGCQTLDNVTIKNAESDVAIESYENVNEGTRLETEIDVPLGETYSWYVSLCDQGECYETDVYEFTNTVEPSDSTSSSTTESNSKALGIIIRDEDYNPKGKNFTPSNTPLTEGYINKIEEDSNQLEPDMDTVGTSTDKTNIWYNTEAGEDSADQYAITKFRNWSINNRGEPFPPATSSQTQHSTFYRDTTERRTSIEDSSVSKTEKVFANSIPVVARETITKNGEKIAYPGQGVWIDPDDIDKTRNGEPYDLKGKSWKSLIDFNMDITGPDWGLGWDYNEDSYQSSSTNSVSTPEFSDDQKVVYTTIHWENNSQGNIKGSLEPPMCGDDEREYLIEEMGQTENSEKYTGTFACSTTPNKCAYNGNLYDIGETVNTNESGERDGERVKNDAEVCAQSNTDIHPHWYDQDYTDRLKGTEICQENDYLGALGQRWIGESYISNHPYAVNQGIDDSWNKRLAQKNHNKLVSNPETKSLSPIPTETDFNVVANPDSGYGMCAGDDDEEYLVHQRSETRYLNEDTSVVGVASRPDKCVLANDRSSVEVVNHDGDYPQNERQLYESGDEVNLNTEDGERVVGCFAGTWWSNWPIVFIDDEVSTTIPNSVKSNFIVINPSDNAIEYELTMSGNSDLVDMSDLDEKTVEVPANSYVNSHIQVNPVRQASGSLQVSTSDGVDGGGSDNTEVNIDSATVADKEDRTVPGMTFIQLAVIAAISSLVFFKN